MNLYRKLCRHRHRRRRRWRQQPHSHCNEAMLPQSFAQALHTTWIARHTQIQRPQKPRQENMHMLIEKPCTMSAHTKKHTFKRISCHIMRERSVSVCLCVLVWNRHNRTDRNSWTSATATYAERDTQRESEFKKKSRNLNRGKRGKSVKMR